MDTLTVELVENILGNRNLDIEDIINVSSTCNHLRSIVNGSNYIWRNVYYKRWPQFKHTIKRHEVDYILEIKYIYGLHRRMRNILETFPSRFYDKIMIDKVDFKEWHDLAAENDKAYVYITDFLYSHVNVQCEINSIECVPLFTPGNKTLRHFCLQVIEHLKQAKVVEYYKELMSLPMKCQLTEKAATLIAQYCQPKEDVQYCNIRKCLDNIAKAATEELRIINSNHPLFGIPPETREKWNTENFEDNIFNCRHNMQIVTAIQTTMFHKMKFAGNETFYYKFENSYIDKVLENKCGLPIVLSIIFESVARRLGLNTEPMNTPAHFLLRFKPDSQDNNVYFIDAFNSGKIFPKGVCPHSRNNPGLVPRATVHQILTRMTSNLELSLRGDEMVSTDLNYVRIVLELGIMLNPRDYTKIANLGALLMSLNMGTTHLHPLLQTVEDEQGMYLNNQFLKKLRNYEANRATDIKPPLQPKKRTERVTFAIGMIMWHRRLHYVGVITGWAPVCEESATWQNRMQVERLQFKNNQPFYEVHATDMTRRYVAQENVEIIQEIEDPFFTEELGRHFSHFFVNHYVPHAAKEKEYPDDTAVRHDFYQSRLWQK